MRLPNLLQSLQRSKVVVGALLIVLVAACDTVFGAKDGSPGRVSDLHLVSISAGSVTIEWTGVDDGTGKPASYAIAYSSDPLDWYSAVENAQIHAGSTVGGAERFLLDDLQRGEDYYVQLVAFRGSVDGDTVFGELSNVLEIGTESDPVLPVEDLTVTSSSATTVSLSWSQIDDGTGKPASFLVGFGVAPLDWDAALSNSIVVPGTASSMRSVMVQGLLPETDYEFQVATVRGTPSDTSQGQIRSAVVGARTTALSAVTPFFEDDFDNGIKTNANGFLWTNTGPEVQVSTTHSISGSYSLAFRYGPDLPGEDSSAEQRFNLGQNVEEMWVEYYLRIPDNFIVRADFPANNKLFATWAGLYSTGGHTQIVFEYERSDAEATRLRVLSMNGGANNSGNHFDQILNTSMRGQWKRLRIHLRIASDAASNDGVIEIWRDNMLVYSNYTHALYFSGGSNYWRNGYFLGWSNSGFAEETVFYIDDVKFYTANPGW